MTDRNTNECELCPFCGNAEPEVSNEYDVFDRWRVICAECGANGPTEPVDDGRESSIKGAVALWNKRA